MPKLAVASLLAACALSTAVMAQTTVRGLTFMQADTDGNGYLDRDEARAAGLGDHFNTLDQDADNRLESPEYEVVASAPGVLVIPESPDQIPDVTGQRAGPPTAGGVTR